MQLEGQAALITGGSRGIGRAIALELARQGAHIGINYSKSEQKALELAETIRSLGREAITFRGSVSEETEVEAIFKQFLDKFGRIDILVGNAGITKDNALVRMKVQDFDEVVHTNLRGTFLCLKHAGKAMLHSRYGRVITISSIVGLTGNPGQASYAASKGGIIALTKTFAREMARADITANIVAPGPIDTDMTMALSEDIRKKIVSYIPKERLGTPDEVAKMVAFLASREAGYITGQVFSINGGMMM